MSLLVTLNGANYIIPQTNEVGWGSNLDDYFVAIAAGVLQKTGGSFTLSAETDFGASYGLKSLYYKSRATNVAATGALRLANAETGIVWRNFLNNADLALTVNASNQLTFNGTPIESNALASAHILVGNGSNIATDVAMSGNIGIDNTGATTIQAGVIVNSMVNASAAIARSKLAALTVSHAMVTDGSGFDAVSATTATELGYVNGVTSAIQTQLDAKQTTTLSSGNILVGNVSNVAASVAMTGDITITNAGVTAIGAGKIVNAQVNASAAIAYSKLALTGSIVNADVSTSAAIAVTKVAIGTANQIIGTNNGATANEFKTLTATANQVSVTHGAGTVTFATPQDIGTSSAVRFGSLTLGGALDASSILSLTSTSKGFLPPVMTTTQKNAISTPTDGLIVYDSSLAQLFLRASSAWTSLSVGGGSGTVASGTQYQLGYYAAGGTTLSGLTLITGSRALASDANGLPIAATTTATELGYVNGVTSAIQTQINTKAPTASPTFTGNAGFGGVAASNDPIEVHSTTSSAFRGQLSLYDSTAFAAGVGGQIVLGGQDSAAHYTEWASIQVQKANSTSGNEDSNFIIRNRSNANGMTTALTIDTNQHVQFVDGTTGSPAITFINDTDTGIYRIGANNIGIACGATKAIDASDSGVAILGTTTNNNAAAGYVGQTVSSAVTSVSAPSTGTFGDVTSITLTAGDWLIWGNINANVTSTTTGVKIGISTTTGNSSTGLVPGDTLLAFLGTITTPSSFPLSIGAVRASLSGTTIYYLKTFLVFSGSPTVDGRITAVRIR